MALFALGPNAKSGSSDFSQPDSGTEMLDPQDKARKRFTHFPVTLTSEVPFSAEELDLITEQPLHTLVSQNRNQLHELFIPAEKIVVLKPGEKPIKIGWRVTPD